MNRMLGETFHFLNLRNFKSLGWMNEERNKIVCGFHCELCENKVLVVEKHKRVVKGSNSCYLLHTKGSYCCYLLHTKGSNPHGNFPIGSSTLLYRQLSPSGSASCSPAAGGAGERGERGQRGVQPEQQHCRQQDQRKAWKAPVQDSTVTTFGLLESLLLLRRLSCSWKYSSFMSPSKTSRGSWCLKNTRPKSDWLRSPSWNSYEPQFSLHNLSRVWMTPIQDSAVTGLVLLARAVYNVNYNTDFHKLTIVPPSTAITTGCRQD